VDVAGSIGDGEGDCVEEEEEEEEERRRRRRCERCRQRKRLEIFGLNFVDVLKFWNESN
jgi:hypothetical protein